MGKWCYNTSINLWRNVMIENALDIIVEQLKPIFTSQKFVKQDAEDCVYVNKDYAYRISYDAERKVYLLDRAILKGEEQLEFTNRSMYLFDDRSTEADAKSVGNDFFDTMNNDLGLAKSVAMNKRDVPLPTKAKGDVTPGIETFCSRFLTLFPAYKDQYREETARYGGFMPDHFFSRTAAVVLRDAVRNGDIKQVNKMAGMLDQYYADGDYEVQSTITYVIIGEAFRNDKELFERFLTLIDNNYKYLRQPAVNIMKFVVSKGK